MSLLNDVLQDLDTRRNPSPEANPNQDLLREYAAGGPVYASGMQRWKRGPVIGGIVAILLVVGIAAWWFLREDPPTDSIATPFSEALDAREAGNIPVSEVVVATEAVTGEGSENLNSGDELRASTTASEPEEMDGPASGSVLASANDGPDAAVNSGSAGIDEVPGGSAVQGQSLESLGASAKKKLGELFDSASSAIRSAMPAGSDAGSESSAISLGSESEAVVVKPVSMLPTIKEPKRQVASRAEVERPAVVKDPAPSQTIKPAPRRSVRPVTRSTTNADSRAPTRRSTDVLSTPVGIKRLYEQDLQMRAHAEQLIRGGALEEAEAELRKFVHDNPGAQHSRSTLAGLLIQMNRAEEGEKLLLGGIVLDSNGRDRVKLMARAQMARGDFEAALRLLDANQLEITEDAEYHSLRAALYQRTGRHAPAVKLYQQLLSEMPAQPAWYVGMAISLESMGQRRDAITAYRQVRDLHTTQPVLKNYAVERIAALTR